MRKVRLREVKCVACSKSHNQQVAEPEFQRSRLGQIISWALTGPPRSLDVAVPLSERVWYSSRILAFGCNRVTSFGQDHETEADSVPVSSLTP